MSRPASAAPPPGPAAPALTLRVAGFEGPLDLLLHLIRSQQLDIRDIPIALVTEQYLACLELMRELDLDLAGEWLVMAATLLHIKSKMLLPEEPAAAGEEAEADPREALVQRLLEYERYKQAAAALAGRELLGRDVFTRAEAGAELADPDVAGDGTRPLEPVSLFDLLSAFARVLAARPRPAVHEVRVERVTVADKIAELLDRLAARASLAFDELVAPAATRLEIVVTFLAVLELVRLRVVRVYQAGPFGPIRLFAAGRPAGDADGAAAG
ncbi:MAG TPA: segregation/condensation protein A, partial [Thermodesulfobacteriota bacterium]|nr:segregation/condensation protein A [Thermodesulfobacteriota bacterium]